MEGISLPLLSGFEKFKVDKSGGVSKLLPNRRTG
jgi:hypothetical protein